MKKAVAWGLAVILCLSMLCGCSSEKGIEDPVELAMEQLGRPTAEAYRNMGLLGDPKKASELFYLYARDGADILGKRLNVAIVHVGGMKKSDKLTEMRTESIEYSAQLHGDYGYVLKLYQALRETYGEAETFSSALPFSEATVESLEASSYEKRYAGLWKKDGREIELDAYGFSESYPDEKGYVTLDVRIPIEDLNLPPIYADDGTRIR